MARSMLDSTLLRIECYEPDEADSAVLTLSALGIASFDHRTTPVSSFARNRFSFHSNEPSRTRRAQGPSRSSLDGRRLHACRTTHRSAGASSVEGPLFPATREAPSHVPQPLRGGLQLAAGTWRAALGVNWAACSGGQGPFVAAACSRGR